MNAHPNPLEKQGLPSGTVTFVFTDIEGSTQRWDRNRAAMQHAVRRHDAIVRAAIAEHGGYVFKTIGDAFCAAFARPDEAVAAMVEAQRGLGAEDFSAVDGLRVRGAIHAGTADERDGDFFGPTVNRVARLLAIAHGGQVVVSEAISKLVGDDLPPQASLRDLGEHRLKDLSRAEHVHQLVAPGLSADFPPLRSLDALPNNLPQQMTSFIGRATEVAEITALVRAHPLVTLVGSGGIGKTRASLQAGASLLEGFRDGVWFVELAPLASGDFIPMTISAAMGMTLGDQGNPLAQLVAALTPKHAFLIIDNCEHLIDASARVIASILRSCPRVKILASTRQALGIAGEELYRMPSLGLPVRDGTRLLSAAQASAAPAVALFVERARSSDKRFVLSDDNAEVVVEICRRLDGIALAIELAAARVRILTPRQLRDRLDERFRVLIGRSRDVVPRQQTLLALIDWSYDLLDERERTLFRRLGIFANGFTLEGAAAAGAGEDVDELDVMDILASLVEKSLVLTEPHGDALRYRLLESTRAYASEKLAQSGERDLLADRHLYYLRHRFADLLADFERTSRSAATVEAFLTELEDLRVAIAQALERPNILGGAELLAALETVWKNVGLNREGLARIEPFIAALPPGESLLLAQLCGVQTTLLFELGMDARSLEVATQAVGYARETDDGPALARALLRLAKARRFAGDVAGAERAFSEADAIPGQSTRFRTGLLEERGHLYKLAGDLDSAARVLSELGEHQRKLGNTRGTHIYAMNVSEIDFQRGETPAAIARIREIIPAVRAGTDIALLANILANLTGYSVASGDFRGALAAGHEALALLAQREPDNYLVACVIEHLAIVAASSSEVCDAAVLEGYADATFARVGFKREFTEQTSFDRVQAILRDNLAPDEVARLEAAGSALNPEAAIALALEVTAP